MDAQTLKRHYESELESRSGGDARHDRRMFRALHRASQALPPCALNDPDSAWVWSDLHLGHDNIIRYARRPFADAEAMDAALYENWMATVGLGDELVFVGDVAMRRALGPATWRRIQEGNGVAKLLVLGNHDLTGGGRLRVHGFDMVGPVMFVEGDPPLLFTHVPLTRVPAGCVNVHGHTHDEPPGGTPHINVSVEQLGYRAPWHCLG